MGMEPVLGFLEDIASRAVDDILCNFIASVCGQTVEEDSILVGNAHELGVDLIILEDLDSLGLLGFLTH